MRRAIRVKLKPTTEQAKSLQSTVELFTKAFNEVCQTGWDEKEKNGVKLHHLTYYRLKSEIPELVSDLHIQARVRATETLRAAFTRAYQNAKVSCPRSSRCPPRYDKHTFKVNWTTKIVRMSTVTGKVNIPFTLPNYFLPMIVGKVCASDLIQKDNGDWWFHITVEIPAPKIPKNKESVGVDLGVNRPAVTSNQKFLGERCWKNTEAKIFKQRRQCRSKGTKSAKRKLRRAGSKQARFRRDCDHVISKQIVDSVKPGGTIVLENLTDILKGAKSHKRQQRRKLHSWSFAQLKTFVTYKAEAVGVRVVLIDPRHTSQCCSVCGHTHRANRRSQSLFKCRSCGFTLNADLNGARNIRNKHLGTFGTSLRIRPSSTGPTNRKVQCGRPKGAICKSSPSLRKRLLTVYNRPKRLSSTS